LGTYVHLFFEAEDNKECPKDDDDDGSLVGNLDGDHPTDKWPARRNPALLAGAEYIQNDEQTFVLPYWISQYKSHKCMSDHVGICVILPAGVCDTSTNNVMLSLEKENSELVIDMKLPSFYTNTVMLKESHLRAKFGKKEAGYLSGALKFKMSTMRETVDDPFIFKMRIPLSVAVNPLISRNDWDLMGDGKGTSRCLMIRLKTPSMRDYEGKGRNKVVTLLHDDSDDDSDDDSEI